MLQLRPRARGGQHVYRPPHLFEPVLLRRQEDALGLLAQIRQALLQRLRPRRVPARRSATRVPGRRVGGGWG
jgi:hypothetical protein